MPSQPRAQCIDINLCLILAANCRLNVRLSSQKDGVRGGWLGLGLRLRRWTHWTRAWCCPGLPSRFCGPFLCPSLFGLLGRLLLRARFSAHHILSLACAWARGRITSRSWPGRASWSDRATARTDLGGPDCCCARTSGLLGLLRLRRRRLLRHFLI